MASELSPQAAPSAPRHSPDDFTVLLADVAALKGALCAQEAKTAALEAALARTRARLSRRLLRAGLVAGLLALTLSGSASAGIPNTATGAIGMCYRTAGSMNLLYVLDPAQQPSCPTGMTQSSFDQNPQQVALLRWSDANQVGNTGNMFSVGTGPHGVAFDGANIWVTNEGTASNPGNTVSKL